LGPHHSGLERQFQAAKLFLKKSPREKRGKEQKDKNKKAIKKKVVMLKNKLAPMKEP